MTSYATPPGPPPGAISGLLRRSSTPSPVRAADTVPKASWGWDNVKKVNGRKRHIAVDVTGLLLAVVVNVACIPRAATSH